MIVLSADVRSIYAVDQQPSVIHFIESHQQIDECRFAGAGCAYDTDHLSGMDRYAQIFQYRLVGFVSEGGMIKSDLAVDAYIFYFFFVLLRHFLRQDIVDTLQTCRQPRQFQRQTVQPPDVLEQQLCIGHKLEQFPG